MQLLSIMNSLHRAANPERKSQARSIFDKMGSRNGEQNVTDYEKQQKSVEEIQKRQYDTLKKQYDVLVAQTELELRRKNQFMTANDKLYLWNKVMGVNGGNVDFNKTVTTSSGSQFNGLTAEGGTWRRETSNVDIEGLSDRAKSTISAAADYFFKQTGRQLIVSSGKRSWGGHTTGEKIDFVDDAGHNTLENNENGIRDGLIAYLHSLGVGAVDEQGESGDYVFLGSTLPPVRRVATTTSSSSNKVNRNIGKMAPVINEILPNPASPQTDADDEFIELYNPNDSNFDLTGFKLAFGSKNPKKYTFPEGTVLSSKQFKAFTSGETSISLSNTEAQVWLLDPNDKVITQSEPYTKAKDGQSWSLDSGKWVWTSVPTPNEINVLSSTGSNTKAKQVATVLGISSTKGGAGEAGSVSAPHKLADKMPVNSVVLAVVGLTAIGYALYEYRYDISNKIYELRRYFKNRREIRRQV